MAKPTKTPQPYLQFMPVQGSSMQMNSQVVNVALGDKKQSLVVSAVLSQMKKQGRQKKQPNVQKKSQIQKHRRTVSSVGKYQGQVQEAETEPKFKKA